MSIRFVLGRAGSGKTHYCLREIARRLGEQREGPLLFLLPEQATFIHERMLACQYTPHGYAGAEVVSFRRLIWQAAKRAGEGPKPALSEAGRALLLGRVLTARRSELRLFGGATLGSGFAKELVATMEELAGYNVRPEALLAAARRRGAAKSGDPLAAKLADLALLYGDYEAAVNDYDNYGAGLSFLALEIAEKGFLRGAQVFVDGFSSFNPLERAVLAALMKQAEGLEIALALDPADLNRDLVEEEIFYPCWQAYGQLSECALQGGVTVLPPHLLSGREGRFAAQPELAFLERHCYPWRGEALWPEPVQAIRVMTAANPREELAAAGREILRLVREQGLRFHEISVIARDTAPYEELLPGVFGDLDIPYFVDAKKPLFYHPLVELVRSALEIWAGEAHYRHIFRYLKTGLTPLSLTETDRLENYCLAHGVRHWQWREDTDWRYWRGGGPQEQAQARLAEINELRRRGTAALAGFLRMAPPASGEVEADSLIAALRGLLSELMAEDTLAQWQEQALAQGRAAEAALHRQALARVLAFLDEAESLLQGGSFSPQQLLSMIDAGASALTLSLIPPGLDQVLVASLERSRNPELAAAIIIGANADILPKKVRPEALLSDYERAELAREGFELAPGTMARQMAEHYLAYIALTRSGSRLMLIHALCGEDGKALLPSPLLKRLRSLFPALKPERYGEPECPAQLEGGAVTLSLLAQKLAKAPDGVPPGFWGDVYNWYAGRPHWQAPLERLRQGLNFKPSRGKLSGGTLARLYGNTLRSSVSRLEKFQDCPFAYFAAYGLKLRPRQVYELTPLERGDIFHQALAEMNNRMQAQALSWRDLDEQQIAGLADQVLAALLPDFLSGILAATARYRYVGERIRATLIATANQIAESLRRGHFTPVSWELPFGNREGDVLPALVLDLGDGKKLELNGQIDRIDMAQSGENSWFRIIDYKTGGLDLRLGDIYSGRQLQLLVYLQVVLENSAYFGAEKGRAAGIYYLPVRDQYLAVEMPPPEQSTDTVGLKLKGLTVQNEQAVRLADPQINGHSKLIPVALSAKGFYSNSPGLAEERLELLRAHLLSLLRESATAMLEGRVEAAPRRGTNFDACMYCDYRQVCGFDGALATPRLTPALAKGEIWRELAGRYGDGC